jgi:hypothetical protein
VRHSHLLNKIQAIGKKGAEKKTLAANGEKAPTPIKRHLLI